MKYVSRDTPNKIKLKLYGDTLKGLISNGILSNWFLQQYNRENWLLRDLFCKAFIKQAFCDFKTKSFKGDVKQILD